MKSNKGVTLIGLIMYVVAFVIIVGIVGTITSFFYSNTQNMNDTATSLGEFNKLNLEMVRETKTEGNKVYSVSNKEGNSYVNVQFGQEGTRIVFTSGTSFTYIGGEDSSVYKDRIKLCSNVRDCKFKVENVEEKQIVSAIIEFDNLSRTVSYVMQENTAQTNTNTEESYTTASGKEYIQNGLVLHYDAINNTGDGHSNSTDTWRDLSPNRNDAILTNVTWGDKYAIFDGVNSWGNCGEQNSDYKTIMITFSANSLSSGNNCIVGNWEQGGGGIFIIKDNNANSKRIAGDYYINEADKYVILKTDDDITEQKIYNICLTYDGEYEILYLNGYEIKSVEMRGTIKGPKASTVLGIGTNPIRDERQQEDFNGKIYSAAVYNRALTHEEILNNYEIDKARYGIEN